MPANDQLLNRWLARAGSRIDKATLGQLMILVELSSATSVAAAGRNRVGGSTSTAVNYRQKLSRLEQALGLGRLVYRDGSVTRPTEIGKRVADETQLFLQELHSISVASPNPTWLIGSGESWLHSVIVPGVVSLASGKDGFRWEVKNLRAHIIAEQLRAGKLHFGFMRVEDAKDVPGIEPTGSSISLPGHKILARDARDAPGDPAGIIRWLINKRRPFVQQGTTWAPMSHLWDDQLKLGGQLKRLQPQVFCETHVQAVSAVAEGKAWCIAPAMLGQHLGAAVRNVQLPTKAHQDEAALYVYPRALGRFAAAETARSALRQELGRRIAEFHT